ncbi:MAG: hypothetical protein AAGD09_13185 [Cyanobacteria bacterium P01_F01_bin.56]
MRKQIQSGQPFCPVVDQAFVDGTALSADCYMSYLGRFLECWQGRRVIVLSFVVNIFGITSVFGSGAGRAPGLGAPPH